MAVPKREQKAVAGIGLVAIIADVGGLLLLIFGIDRHFHYSPLSSECGTTLGQLGQGASQALQTECSHASTWSVLGFVLAVIGAVVLVWGLKLSGSALAWKIRPAPDPTVPASAENPPCSGKM
jgi:hypothetical protein